MAIYGSAQVARSQVLPEGGGGGGCARRVAAFPRVHTVPRALRDAGRKPTAVAKMGARDSHVLEGALHEMDQSFDLATTSVRSSCAFVSADGPERAAAVGENVPESGEGTFSPNVKS